MFGFHPISCGRDAWAGGGGAVELNCSAPTRCQRFLMLGLYQCFVVDANVSVSWQPTAELHSRGQDHLKPVVEHFTVSLRKLVMHG